MPDLRERLYGSVARLAGEAVLARDASMTIANPVAPPTWIE